MANIIRIIIAFIFTFIFITFLGFNLSLEFNKSNGIGIRNAKCSCKFSGPYSGKIKILEDDKEIKNFHIICWWETKRKTPSDEIIYETIKMLKTQIDEEGNFLIPEYPQKKNKYICCPKGIVYNNKYLNFINFSRKIECFKKREGCIIYLRLLNDEEKAEILKIIPADVKKVLKECLINFDEKKNGQ